MNAGGREDLRVDFLEKTGIDLATYRRPEIVEAVADLVGFPRTVTRCVFVPIALAVVVIGVGAFPVEGVGATLLWLGMGGVLAVLLGFLLGLWLLLRLLTGHLESMITVLLGTVSAVWRDAAEVRHRHREDRLALPSALVTSRAVAEVVLVPQCVEAVTRGVVLVGPLLRKPVEWFCSQVFRRVLRAEREIDPAIMSEEVPVERVVQVAGAFERASEVILASSDSILSAVRGLATFLLVPAVVLVSVLLALLTWWLW